MFMYFAVVDIEVVNNAVTSIATIGIVGVDKGEIVETKEFKIKPEPFIFDKEMTAVNGLEEKDFLSAPTFPEIWIELSECLKKYDFCVAHNASFDFGVIRGCCKKYNLDYSDFVTVDSLTYARNSHLDVPNCRLDTLCEKLDIKCTQYHNALFDAVATAKILLKLIDLNDANILDLFLYGATHLFSDYKPRGKISIHYIASYWNNTEYVNKHSYIDSSSWGLKAQNVAAAEIDLDESNLFNGKKVVISGELETMNRENAYSVLKACGAEVCDNITLTTNYLITNAERATGKIKKALEYIERGKDIKIINEGEFIEILKGAGYETN